MNNEKYAARKDLECLNSKCNVFKKCFKSKPSALPSHLHAFISQMSEFRRQTWSLQDANLWREKHEWVNDEWFPHCTSSEWAGQCSTQETFVWPVTEANYIIMQQVNKWVMKRKSSAHLEALLHLSVDTILLTLNAALRSWCRTWKVTIHGKLQVD